MVYTSTRPADDGVDNKEDDEEKEKDEAGNNGEITNVYASGNALRVWISAS